MTPSESQAVLVRHCLAEDGKGPSASIPQKQPRPEARNRAWWLDSPHAHERPPKGRARGLLKAYIEIAGPRFFATGIPVGDRFIHPDKGAMKSLLLYGLVRLETGRFIVTDDGRSFLSQPSGSRWNGPILPEADLERGSS